MVTARGSEADKIRGLKLGADDYITKPLSFPELSARVEAALRRAATAAPEQPRRLKHRDLVIDLDDHRAHLRGTEVHLTPTEFRLLAHLMEHAGQLATHRQVLGAVWGAGYDRDVHLLRMTIRNLADEAGCGRSGRALHHDGVRPGLSTRRSAVDRRLTAAAAPFRPVPALAPPAFQRAKERPFRADLNAGRPHDVRMPLPPRFRRRLERWLTQRAS